ncbi:hypothetical protein EYC84_006814 [Monilinia fructicola]|uniref:Uncharacterized protein n=1 Tax=Monilinia fructicola TaxID=38448 RepID=A0A5M9K8D4_MONFR|nr:hypothetical protein EYC84_006814 [Monilinia fructicola]
MPKFIYFAISNLCGYFVLPPGRAYKPPNLPSYKIWNQSTTRAKINHLGLSSFSYASLYLPSCRIHESHNQSPKPIQSPLHNINENNLGQSSVSPDAHNAHGETESRNHSPDNLTLDEALHLLSHFLPINIIIHLLLATSQPCTFIIPCVLAQYLITSIHLSGTQNLL